VAVSAIDGLGEGARDHRPRLTMADGTSLAARIVVGADGGRSIVASTVAVARRSSIGPRVALTFHVPESEVPRATPGSDDDARMVVIRDGYVGLAPVPGARSNVGIVLGA